MRPRRWRRIGLAAATMLTVVHANQSAAVASTPFTCSPNFYQVSTSSTSLYKFDPTNNQFSTLSGVGPGGFNALGYNPADNYLYAIKTSNSSYYRIDSAGTYTLLGTLSGTGTLQTSGGDFWGDNVQLTAGSTNTWTKINTTALTYAAYPVTGSVTWNTKDMTIVGNTAYGLEASTLYIVALGPTSGTITSKTVTGLDSGGTYGAAYADSSGNVYFFNNNTVASKNNMFKIAASDLASASASIPATLVTSASPALGAPNDGASCQQAANPFDPPTPVNDTYAMAKGNTLTVNGSGGTKLVANDQAGTTFAIKSVTFNGTTITSAGSIVGANGTLNVTDFANGYFTFTPSGTFTGNQTFTYDLIETAGATRTSSSSATVTVYVLGVTTSSLPDGTAGDPYTTSLAADGGSTGTSTWSTSSTLPDGLTLASDGTLSGTPTAASTGTYSFTVTNGGVTSTRTLTLTIAGAATTTTTSTTSTTTTSTTTSTTSTTTTTAPTTTTTTTVPATTTTTTEPATTTTTSTTTTTTTPTTTTTTPTTTTTTTPTTTTAPTTTTSTTTSTTSTTTTLAPTTTTEPPTTVPPTTEPPTTLAPTTEPPAPQAPVVVAPTTTREVPVVTTEPPAATTTKAAGAPAPTTSPAATKATTPITIGAPTPAAAAGAPTTVVTAPGVGMELGGADPGSSRVEQGQLVLVAGRTGRTSGYGFEPGSKVEVRIVESATPLGVVTVGPDGRFELAFTIPTEVGDAQVTVQASGRSADGTAKSLRAAVKVSVLGNEVSRDTPANGLAFTGSETSSMIVTALVLLLAGGVATLISRRRRASQRN